MGPKRALDRSSTMKDINSHKKIWKIGDSGTPLDLFEEGQVDSGDNSRKHVSGMIIQPWVITRYVIVFRGLTDPGSKISYELRGS